MAAPSSATRFLITCAARTGSTLLRNLLTSHPEITCHGELFGLERMTGFMGLSPDPNQPFRQWLTGRRDEHPVEFLTDVAFHAGDMRAVGLKIKYAELEAPRWRDVLEYLRQDRSIHIIHLTRENRLKRYVSHRIVAVTHVTQARQPEDVPGPVRLRFDPHDCRKDIEATAEAEQRFRAYFHRHPVFDISYERLLNPATGTLDSLQRFLGVEPAPLQTSTLKLNSDRLEDLLENYQEIKDAFRGTPYSAYLDRD